MEDLEAVGRELQRRGKTEALKKLADSADGRRLGRMLDAEAVKQAAQRGDGESLRQMMSQVLSTGEGQRLLRQLQAMMKE